MGGNPERAAPQRPELLLSRDLRLDVRDLRPDEVATADGQSATQIALPGFTPAPVRARARRSQPAAARKAGRTAAPADDPLLAAFRRRLAAQGRARKGQRAYLYQMRSMLAIAARLCGRPLDCAGLVRDERLLGRVLVDETAPTLGTRVSRWTLAQRRSAARGFAALMRPELARLLGEDPHRVLDRALRSVAERVGAGFRLRGGAPRRRGGRAPTAAQVADVLVAAGRAPGYVGLRNRAFFRILAETGARVDALRMLDGADCVEMPNGRLRVFLHEKGAGEPREVELGRGAATALRAYADGFNYHAAVRRWSARARIGEAGAIWRNSARGRWPAEDIRNTLRAACLAAEVLPFAPHALRRAFATDAASVLPRHTVAQAGGWRGLERLDDHYVRPRAAAIRDKLARRASPSPTTDRSLV